MPEDEELKEFIEDELQKDITQEDTVDESVEQHLGEMGFLWDRVNIKLKEDNICFDCKKEMDKEEDTPHLLEANKVDKGVVAFVLVCKKCFDKVTKNDTNKNK